MKVHHLSVSDFFSRGCSQIYQETWIGIRYLFTQHCWEGWWCLSSNFSLSWVLLPTTELAFDHFLVSLTSLPALVSNIFFILTSQEEGGLLLPSESEIVLWCLGSRNNSSVRRSAETTMRLSTAKLVDGRLVLDIHKNAFLQSFFFPPHFRVSYTSGLEKQNFHPFKSLFFLTFAPCSFLF